MMRPLAGFSSASRPPYSKQTVCVFSYIQMQITLPKAVVLALLSYGSTSASTTVPQPRYGSSY